MGSMGIERTVTLWYLHRQMLLQELASLEAQLVQMRAITGSESEQSEVRGKTIEGGSYPPLAEIEKQSQSLQKKLHDLGPCPRPMMG